MYVLSRELIAFLSPRGTLLLFLLIVCLSAICFHTLTVILITLLIYTSVMVLRVVLQHESTNVHWQKPKHYTRNAIPRFAVAA